MKPWILVFWMLALLSHARAQQAPAGTDPFAPETAAADRLYAEGSFARAAEAYAALLASLPADGQPARWARLRELDARWRHLAAGGAADASELEAVGRALEALQSGVERPEQQDRLWAETEEALGDFHWLGGQGWRGHSNAFYQRALDWWARSTDLELARARWLGMLERMGLAPWDREPLNAGQHGNPLPIERLEQALSIAREPRQRAFFALVLARDLLGRGASRNAERRGLALLAEVEGLGDAGGLADAALRLEASWCEQVGPWVQEAQGPAQRRPDLARAVALYRRFLERFPEGQSAHRPFVAERLAALLAEELEVSDPGSFRAAQPLEVQLGWRNLTQVEGRLVPLELTRDPELRRANQSPDEWLASVALDSKQALASFRVELPPGRPHERQQRRFALAEWLPKAPPAGAYALELRAAGKRSRCLLLITDLALVAEQAPGELIAWVVGADDGAPRAGLPVKAWIASGSGSGARWRVLEAQSDAQGLARFALEDLSAEYTRTLLAAGRGAGQALLTIDASGFQPEQGWRLLLTTDRPAYRPGQTAHWKLTARRHLGLAYETPAGQELVARFMDPRGELLREERIRLSAFGSAHGSLELGAAWALGAYQVQFQDPAGAWIGAAPLLRLEEYKLPEFEVQVRVAEREPGRPKVHVLGDTVEAEIEARTYFGAAVGGGAAEVIVRRKPLGAGLLPEPRWGWFAAGLRSPWDRDGWGWRAEEEVLRRSLVLDGEGRAKLSFETPADDGQEWEYRIEARVTDAARREVSGSGSVRVRRQAYAVVLHSERSVVRPGQAARVQVRAEDANGQPAAVSGRLTLSRARWVEVWRDPAGVVRSGAELSALRTPSGELPPGCVPLERRYVFEELRGIDLNLDAAGRGEWLPELPATGSYVVRWSSDDPQSGPVSAETWLYAADERTRSLDLPEQGLSIVFDAESLAEGDEAALLVLCDSSDRHVLFSLAAERLIEARVLHGGTAQLVRVPLDARHVPNVFARAVSVRGGRVQRAAAELAVAPARHFLNLAQRFDREVYRPGERGQLELLLTDRDGKPVQGELSVAVYDAAVAAIASEERPDPRTFFYAHPRALLASGSASLEQRPFAEPQAEEPAPSDEAAVVRSLEALGYLEEGGLGRRAGKAFGRLAQAAPGAPPAAAPAENALADRAEPGAGGGGGSVVVRSDFRETALWTAALETDAQGRAQLEVPFSEATTRWNLSVGAVTRGADFGDLRAAPARTSLPIVARLALPRFAVVGDRFTVGGLVTNSGERVQSIELSLALEGLEQAGPGPLASRLELAPGETRRVDFALVAERPGEARLTLRAEGQDASDALERRLPIEERGLEQLLAQAGRLDGERLELELEIPAARPGSGSIEVLITPEPALAALDALPYLTHFPYGCLEQTLSRFVPTAVAMGALRRLGLSAEQVASASFGGIERAFAAKTQPLGREDFGAWQRAAEEGLGKVLAWQSPEGGWSWWPGGPEDRWMSAYAGWSLCLARQAGLDVPTAALERAADHLTRRLIEAEAQPDLGAWLLFALVELERALERAPSAEFQRSFRSLYAARGQVGASARAFLLRAAHHLGANEEQRILLDNLSNGARRDEDPGSGLLGQRQGLGSTGARPRVHWGQPGLCWRWADAAVEATGFTLMVLAELAPEHELLEPALEWLVHNRRAGQWRSTRETAIAVLALCRRLETSAPRAAGVGYTLALDGRELCRVEPGADVLAAVRRVRIDGLDSGRHGLELVRTHGEGPLHWASGVRCFSLEQPLRPAANELFVERQYFRLVPKETLLAGRLFERRPLAPGERLASGDRVEVVLLLEPKADLEYLLVEDLKPAGLEATELESGGSLYAARLSRREQDYRFGALPAAPVLAAGDGPLRPADAYSGEQRFCYRELRDRKVALFIDALPAGLWELRYTLRAETPGEFQALPAVGQAMYVPEIRANSAEQAVVIDPQR